MLTRRQVKVMNAQIAKLIGPPLCTNTNPIDPEAHERVLRINSDYDMKERKNEHS